MNYPKWKAGDLFIKPPLGTPPWITRATVIYRVHRVHGSQVFYLPNEYGAYPARGIIREAKSADTVSWVKVERNYAK